MKIYKEDSEYLWLFCPAHDDKKTGNLCVNKTDSDKYPKGYAYCYACGYTIFFSKEAVDKMSKIKSICREKKPINWEKLLHIYWNYDITERKSWKLAKTWKVNSFGCYDFGYDGEAITVPMWNEHKEVVGIHRRFPDGSKSCVTGSQLGLFIPTTVWDKIIITEGLSDSTVATHLGYFGIGKPCAGFGEELVRKYLENINYDKEIIICQDNDSAGLKNRIKLQSILQNWKVKIVIPDTDLKDYYLKNGFDQTVSLLELG